MPAPAAPPVVCAQVYSVQGETAGEGRAAAHDFVAGVALASCRAILWCSADGHCRTLEHAMTGRLRTSERARRKSAEKPAADLDAELDRALAQTFPASDPFSVGRFTSTEPPSRPVDHEPPKTEAVPRRRQRKS